MSLGENLIGNYHCAKSGDTKIVTGDRTTHDKPALGHPEVIEGDTNEPSKKHLAIRRQINTAGSLEGP